MPINIRPTTRRDKPAIIRILKALPEFTPIEVTVAEELIDAYLEDAACGYNLITALNPAVVGYVCYGPTPLTEGTWDLYWIAVAPEAQGQGVGKKLMEFTEERVREAQGRLLVVETASKPSYDKTRRFYAGLDYPVVCRIPDFYAPGDDKLMLVKRLT